MCISFLVNFTNFENKRGKIIFTFMALKHLDVEGEQEHCNMNHGRRIGGEGGCGQHTIQLHGCIMRLA